MVQLVSGILHNVIGKLEWRFEDMQDTGLVKIRTDMFVISDNSVPKKTISRFYSVFLTLDVLYDSFLASTRRYRAWLYEVFGTRAFHRCLVFIHVDSRGVI